MRNSKLKQILDFEQCFWGIKEIKEAKGIYSELFDNNLLAESSLKGRMVGHSSVQDVYLQWLEAFPNIEFYTINSCEIDNVVFRQWQCTGTHTGILQNIAPTGKKIQCTGKSIYQFNEHVIINYTCYLNIIDLYSQLGYCLQPVEYDRQNNYHLLITKLTELTQHNNIKLTARELEILSYWLFGHSLKSIGAVFNISPRTAEAHIEHIKYKLLCNSKYDLQNLIHSKKIYHLFQYLYLLIAKRISKQ